MLLGIVAWPKPNEPQWKAAVVVLGMVASIVGMGVRWLSNRKDRRDIEHAEAEARIAEADAIKADGHARAR